MAARLLLVASLHPDRLADGLTVGDTGLLEGDLDAKFALELGNQHIEVLLAQAGDDLLVGFGVGDIGGGEVLLHQPLEALRNLALIRLGLGDNRHREGRGRELGLLKAHHPLGIAQAVAGHDLIELGGNTDIARADLAGVGLLGAHDIDELAKADGPRPFSR